MGNGLNELSKSFVTNHSSIYSLNSKESPFFYNRILIDDEQWMCISTIITGKINFNFSYNH